MSNHLTPLQVVEHMIGPIGMIAAIVKVHEKAPYHWRHSSQRHDGGDIPSTRYQRLLLDYAAENNIPLRPKHLIFGASRAELNLEQEAA
ncbi:MAG: hypothetical protein JKY93_03545 [Gammaproteobacteria bacterium]|nr:hypothetical protein [Gammaproteobacteria bacterium]